MEKVSFGHVNNHQLEENFIKSLKNPNFVKVVNTLKTKDEIKYRYTSQLMEIANNLEVCAKCKSLEHCPYEIKGLYKMAIVENDLIKFVYRKCPFKEKEDQEKAHLKNVYTYKMPQAIAEASFKNIYKDDSNRLEAIRQLKKFYDDYLEDKKIKGIYLNGNFGCGKTYLIAALFNELAKKGVKSTIVYFPEFLRSLKASFNGNDDEYNSRFEEVKYARVLLLDDIGAEKLSDWARDEVLGVILQYRMEENLPTFFTSNLTLEELEIHLSIVKNTVDKVKARRIIERIKYLCQEIKMISINRRN